MKFEKVRMGMIGGGQGAFIGAVHRCAANLDGRIEWVCGAFSQDHQNTLITGSQLGIDEDRLYVDWQTMLEQEAKKPADQRMECVSIVTPNHLHMPIASMAIELGFHVICDKPAGLSYTEVELFAKQLIDTDRLFGLTHTYLGYPMVWQARHMIEQGELGRLRKVYVEYPQGWLASAQEEAGSKQATWRTDPSKAGLAGCMGDIGTHAHNLVDFICSTHTTKLSASLFTHFDSRQLDDDGCVLLELANGASGVLTASQVCAGEENALKIRVYGEKGGLEWHQMEPNSLIHKPADGSVQILRAGVDKPLCDQALDRCRLPSGHPEGYLEAFANLYRDFAIAIRAHQIHTASGVPGVQAGLAGMAFLEAVVNSHQNKGSWTNLSAPIDLPQ